MMTENVEEQLKVEAEHYCALCDALLTPENNSREHLLPNGIGGTEKSTQRFFAKRATIAPASNGMRMSQSS
jgi:hypothetical protein